MNEIVNKALKPWAIKPFQFLFHAEIHYQNSSDYGKRMAFISFDNSIEVTIYTFMHFNAGKKGLKIYKKEDLDKTKDSFFEKLKIFEDYLKSKGLPNIWDKTYINYYHEQRNNQYHDAKLSTPDTHELYSIRQIAIWVFSVLFSIPDVELCLKSAITESEKSYPEIPQEFTKPRIEGIQKNQETALFIAAILGGWNENSQGDEEIIREVTSGF